MVAMMGHGMERGLDMEAVGRRILELVEVAVRDHLDGVGRSQAEGLMAMMREEGIDGNAGFGRVME